jgi:LmbE family N-acetylglucosaminyl deacetylase
MNKKVLVVAAHPDDEVLGCGGTIARHSSDGDEVYVIYMTNGVEARGENTQAVIERAEAAEKSCKNLGVKSYEFFDFPDNQMDTVALLKIIQAIEGVIKRFRPEVIYTHHVGDLNIDHQLTHRAVMTACRPVPEFCVREIYAFEVASASEWQTPGVDTFIPNVFIDISRYLEKKNKSLHAYSMELKDWPHARSLKALETKDSTTGSVVGQGHTEAFMLIRKIC